jgi:hypothetical protein
LNDETDRTVMPRMVEPAGMPKLQLVMVSDVEVDPSPSAQAPSIDAALVGLVHVPPAVTDPAVARVCV